VLPNVTSRKINSHLVLIGSLPDHDAIWRAVVRLFSPGLGQTCDQRWYRSERGVAEYFDATVAIDTRERITFSPKTAWAWPNLSRHTGHVIQAPGGKIPREAI